MEFINGSRGGKLSSSMPPLVGRGVDPTRTIKEFQDPEELAAEPPEIKAPGLESLYGKVLSGI